MHVSLVSVHHHCVQQPTRVLHALLQVLYWLDFVGLSQHRYKFSHHAVDGRMLLKLTDEMLRKFIGIHSLGQRQQIMECIEVLPGFEVCNASPHAIFLENG